jgi:hypothetical protein
MDAYFPIHSYFMELYICSKAGGYAINDQNCGVMKIGGHQDFGPLVVPHYSDRGADGFGRVVRPGGTVDFGGGMVMDVPADTALQNARSGEPYVFLRDAEDVGLYRSSPPRLGHTTEQWSANDLDCESGSPCRNRYARFLAQVNDGWLLINPTTPNVPVFICRDGSCGYNGSLIGLEEIAVQVLQSWQAGGNGFVTLNGWSDRWGNPRFDGSCSSISMDCVPLVLQHVPVGYAASKHFGCLCSREREYDISPAGEHWIEFPN